MRRLFITALILLGLAGSYYYRSEAVRRSAERDLVGRKLALAEQENTRLRQLVQEREAERAQERNRVIREQVEREVENIRGLKFKKPVEYQVVSRAELHGVLARKLSEVYTEAEFGEMAHAFTRFGLLPRDYPLRQAYLDLLGEQVAAFYDQHTHKLVMFKEASLESAQNRVILAHELTHALQDQHFDLQKLPLEIKDNDDRALAASALVEGEATLVMTQYQLKNLSLQSLKETATSTLGQSMAQLEKAPRFLRELLIFPYLRGQEFCTTLTNAGGYERLSDAYKTLPRSSAAILHPQLYLAPGGEQTSPVSLPDLSLLGEKPALANVLGELGTRLELEAGGVSDTVAEAAAEGWRGDRYLYFPKHDALIWKSAWANAAEAAEFAAAERQLLEKRYSLKQPREDGLVFQADQPRAIRLIQSGNGEVVVIDAATTAEGEELRAQLQK